MVVGHTEKPMNKKAVHSDSNVSLPHTHPYMKSKYECGWRNGNINIITDGCVSQQGASRRDRSEGVTG